MRHFVSFDSETDALKLEPERRGALTERFCVARAQQAACEARSFAAAGGQARSQPDPGSRCAGRLNPLRRRPCHGRLMTLETFAALRDDPIFKLSTAGT